MRVSPDPFRLSFLLPDGADLVGALERFRQPADGNLTVFAAGLVSIGGRSREAVFNNIAEFVRQLRLDAPQAIAVTMVTTRDPARGMPSGRDSWTIVVGADVAFAPTGLGLHFPPALARQPPDAIPNRRRAG